MKDIAGLWRKLQDEGGHCRPMKDIAGLWRTLQDYEGHCRTMKEIAELWRTLQDYEGHCRTMSMKAIAGLWRTLQDYEGHCRTIKEIAGLWRTLQGYEGYCRTIKKIAGHNTVLFLLWLLEECPERCALQLFFFVYLQPVGLEHFMSFFYLQNWLLGNVEKLLSGLGLDQMYVILAVYLYFTLYYQWVSTVFGPPPIRHYWTILENSAKKIYEMHGGKTVHVVIKYLSRRFLWAGGVTRPPLTHHPISQRSVGY